MFFDMFWWDWKSYYTFFWLFLSMMIDLSGYDVWISHRGICCWVRYELCFISRGLCNIFRRNSFKFLVDVRVLEYFGLSCLCSFRYPFFKQVLILMYALRILRRYFWKPELTQGHTEVAACSISGLGHDTTPNNTIRSYLISHTRTPLASCLKPSVDLQSLTHTQDTALKTNIVLSLKSSCHTANNINHPTPHQYSTTHLLQH